jgi:hypothetical protein
MNFTKNFQQIPRQKVSRKQKTEKWAKETAEAIISSSNFEPGHIGDRDLMRKAYEYYNGIIDDDDYTHVLRPYGKTRKNFPAKLHNYPIIKPVIDLLLGEKRKRPLTYTVAVANPDAITKKEEAIKDAVLQNMQQQFINELSRQGVQTDLSEGDVEMPEEIQKAMMISYQDARAIRGQESLDYLMQKLRLRNEFNKAWFHFVVSGLVITYRDVIGDEPHFEALNPLDIDFDKSPDTEFIEDGDWVVHRRLATPARVIDLFYEHLSSDQVDRIERPEHARSEAFLLYSDMEKNEENKDRLVEVMQVYWKSMKKVGVVSYIDEDGMLQEQEVEDGYKSGPDEKVEWFWVNEVWETTRIDGDIFIKSRACPIQRNSIDNLSICKLPINGRKYSDTNAPSVSVVMLGIPYQLNYNIFKYRLEVALAKSKDLIAQFDINMMPKGWDMDKWMYFLDATGIAWADYAKEGISLNPQHQSVLDMSMKTIQDWTVLLESVRNEWMELAGVNRQRLGGVSQYDGKATVEQSIIQSSHITEDLFAKFGELEQRDLQALLDYSKIAWINGKKAMYVLSDLSQAYLDVDGVQHMESEYGVFVSDAARDLEKVQAAQALGQAMAQNGAPLSTIVDIIDATSLPQIRAKIKEAEASMQKLQQAQQQAEMEAEQARQQFEQMKLDRESEEKGLDRQNKIDVALISAESQRGLAELNISGLDDERTIMLEREKLNQSTQLEREKLAQKSETDRRKAENDRIKADAAMKSASRNPGSK